MVWVLDGGDGVQEGGAKILPSHEGRVVVLVTFTWPWTSLGSCLIPVHVHLDLGKTVSCLLELGEALGTGKEEDEDED